MVMFDIVVVIDVILLFSDEHRLLLFHQRSLSDVALKNVRSTGAADGAGEKILFSIPTQNIENKYGHNYATVFIQLSTDDSVFISCLLTWYELPDSLVITITKSLISEFPILTVML